MQRKRLHDHYHSLLQLELKRYICEVIARRQAKGITNIPTCLGWETKLNGSRGVHKLFV